MCQIEDHEIHYGKGLVCTPVSIRSLEHHAGHRTFRLVSTSILREHPVGGQGLPNFLPFHQPHERWLGGYLEFSPAVKAPYIYKHISLPRNSNPGPTAQQSASLTTIRDGWLLNFTNFLLSSKIVTDEFH
ncbi:hypothetical protein TNCV_3053231 [Trichonephila clavipes]|uniref:Uncharacterized protein n=1 Tax=Trichonephila clavipes TaxID=2585209 RepID=A0A8X6RYD7_TRICX|nr:hypothetical protein TNCV_3053231 [Trichonephila clavipes]